MILIGDEVSAKVGRYVLGNLFTSLIAGLGTFIWLFAFHVPYPIVLALMVALFDLIPIVGSTVGGIIEINLLALKNDAKTRKQIIPVDLPSMAAYGPVVKAGYLLLPSGLMPVDRTGTVPGAARADTLPQMDFANVLTTYQVLWGAVIFLILYILASRTALPKVAAVLEARAERIAGDLDDARISKARADAGIKAASDATAKARSEAQAAINAMMPTTISVIIAP